MTPLPATALPFAAPVPGPPPSQEIPGGTGDTGESFLDMFTMLQPGLPLVANTVPYLPPDPMLTGDQTGGVAGELPPLLPAAAAADRDARQAIQPEPARTRPDGGQTSDAAVRVTLAGTGQADGIPAPGGLSQDDPLPPEVMARISAATRPDMPEAIGRAPIPPPMPPAKPAPSSPADLHGTAATADLGEPPSGALRTAPVATREGILTRPIRTEPVTVTADSSRVVADPDLVPVMLAEDVPLSAPPTETRRMATDPAIIAARPGPEGPPPAERQIVTAILASGTGRTDILLDPQDLGRVRLSLEGNEAGLVVTIMAERGETTDLLRRNADLLLAEFRDAGYANLTFSFADRGDGPDPWAEPESATGGTGPFPDIAQPANPDRGSRGPGVLDLRL